MGQKIKRYAVLTPFEKADVVAGIAAIQKLDVDVVPTKSGALIVRELPVPQYDEWDIRNILGPDESDLKELEENGEPSDNAPAVAAFFSRLSKFGTVLIDVDLGEDVGIEAGVSGLVRARRFQNGEPGEEIPSGLLLNALDPVIERVVLGQKKPSELRAVHSKDMSPKDLIGLMRNREQEGGEPHIDEADTQAETGAAHERHGFFDRFRKKPTEGEK
ncbi:hypothetical protein I6E29_03285 [Arcanobacterium haemolyticum]|nr:hypothetical protein [Arcanobacterium haemolyticum]